MKANGETTILNVDDNEAGRYAITRILQRAGYKVLEAGTGAQVLRQLESEPIDLVILDINLPDVSGLELCGRIKEDPRFSRLPILHLTATYVMSVDRLDESKADGYLMQPVEPAALLANIRALLRARAAETDLAQELQEWRSALDSAGVGICVVGTGDKVLQSNRAFRDEFGQGAAHLTGPLHDLLRQMKSSGARASETVSLDGRVVVAYAYPIAGAVGTEGRAVVFLV